MTGATTAGQKFKLPDGRSFTPGDRRRGFRFLVKGICIGLGSVVAATALVATVMVAAAWLMRSTLSSNPYLRAKATFAVAASDPADRDLLIEANQFAGSPRMVVVAAKSNAALDALVFDAGTARAMTSGFRPRTVIAPQLPMPRNDLQPELAYAPTQRSTELTRVATLAALPSLPAAEVAPDIVMALPPLPRPHPGKREPDRSAPQVAVAPLTTGSIPDAGTIQEGNAKASRLPDAGRVAVYDISASMVYLPNGDRLEAHSGFGNKRDDPRYAHVRNRGPTPPNIYDLTLREKLFHGVRAVRLNPIHENKMFGRDGMLAHTYMLGPNGQSNGCVSFKDYPRFLRAFLRGEVDRLVVVPRLGNESWRTVADRARFARRYADNTR